MSRCALMIVVAVTVCATAGGSRAGESNAKSTTTAVLYSVTFTVVPGMHPILFLPLGNQAESDACIAVSAALGTLGLLMGPGAGHLYAGRRDRWWLGVELRLLGLTAMVVGAYLYGASRDYHPKGSRLLIVTGGLLLFGSALYDVLTVSRSVDRYNRAQWISAVSVKPHYDSRLESVGMRLAVSF